LFSDKGSFFKKKLALTASEMNRDVLQTARDRIQEQKTPRKSRSPAKEEEKVVVIQPASPVKKGPFSKLLNLGAA
jgi:hypothetical protein